MTRLEILNQLNEYFVDDSETAKQSIAQVMNKMILDKSHAENLDLFFMAISITQFYGYLSYLTEDEKNYFVY